MFCVGIFICQGHIGQVSKAPLTELFTRADRGGEKQIVAQISMLLTARKKTTTFSRQVKMQTFPTLHTNLWKCSRHTFLKEGFRGFYSGTLPGASKENLPIMCQKFFCSSGCHCCRKLSAVHGVWSNPKNGLTIDKARK